MGNEIGKAKEERNKLFFGNRPGEG